MPRPVAFQIATANPDRIADFYKDVFGWNFKQVAGQDFWQVSTGQTEPGIDGVITKKAGSVQNVTNAVLVPSIDDFLARVQAKGGKSLVPKTDMPGIGLYAVCADPDNNAFGVLQRTGLEAGELSGEELEAVHGGAGTTSRAYSKW